MKGQRGECRNCSNPAWWNSNEGLVVFFSAYIFFRYVLFYQKSGPFFCVGESGVVQKLRKSAHKNAAKILNNRCLSAARLGGGRGGGRGGGDKTVGQRKREVYVWSNDQKVEMGTNLAWRQDGTISKLGRAQ